MIVMVPFAEGMRLETRRSSKVDFDTTNSLNFGKMKNYLTETRKVTFISGNVFRIFQSIMAKNMADKLSILLQNYVTEVFPISRDRKQKKEFS